MGRMGSYDKAALLQRRVRNKPYELGKMLRLHVLQNLYDLSDGSDVGGSHRQLCVSGFCRVDSSNQVPDGIQSAIS